MKLCNYQVKLNPTLWQLGGDLSLRQVVESGAAGDTQRYYQAEGKDPEQN